VRGLTGPYDPAVPLAPVVLLVPSAAARTELPRRLATATGALAGLVPLTLGDLARSLAEPVLSARGLRPWHDGHSVRLAARLLAGPHGLGLRPDTPLGPVARALSRTLAALRHAGVAPDQIRALARAPGTTSEDTSRLVALAGLLGRYDAEIQGHFADGAALLLAARDEVAAGRGLSRARVIAVGDLEPDEAEQKLLEALARAGCLELVADRIPPSLAHSGFEARVTTLGARRVAWEDTPLAAIAPSLPPPALLRLRERLFEPPAGETAADGSLELVTGPGEAAEARAIARRLLREAERGVPFEEMAVVLNDAGTYAPLFADLLDRLGIPHRLHPSLPLRSGRAARSLLLLFRCRGLERAAVMEFLTFAPLPFGTLLGDDQPPRPAQWDAISRDAGIVSGYERWLIGLRAYAEGEREAGAREAVAERKLRRQTRAREAERLLRVVELLAGTLDGLSGEAGWPEWSERVGTVVDQWLEPERDTKAVAEVVAELAALGRLETKADWHTVETVIETRFEWEQLPLEPVRSGAVHVGALKAIAGLPFRVVAIPGLVEGGFPGPLRPDPLLLDREREVLNRSLMPTREAPVSGKPRAARRQLSLFDPPPAAASEAQPEPVPLPALPTTQDRLLAARRLFHRAVSQASERLILSYPRADPRTGRERLPSLFFVAAASAAAGRPLGTSDLEALVAEDDPQALRLEQALDRGERDRARVLASGQEAVLAIAAGSPFFRQSRLASEARWSRSLTPYDGLVAFPAGEPESEAQAAAVRARLDPVASGYPLSASRLATFGRCGYQYLLQHVLRLEPLPEPEERRKLAPLERGTLFHEVAELFLRELRDTGALPVRDTEEQRERLLVLADEALGRHVQGSPPRLRLLWDRECRRFRDTLLSWLAREAANAERSTPLHFEVGFGLPVTHAAGAEPHGSEPLEIDLGDGRMLRVSGKIDRIDEKPDETLLLRDYKTGRAPRDDGSVFRGGKNLQIPFYVRAAEKLFPGRRVSEAFLDYVDSGRPVAMRLELARGADFQEVLRRLLDAIAGGIFVQEPASCEFCDFTLVCGPSGLIAQRLEIKRRDPRLKAVQELRRL
jgi:ATP-dependent helicase/nuclease subunit B